MTYIYSNKYYNIFNTYFNLHHNIIILSQRQIFSLILQLGSFIHFIIIIKSTNIQNMLFKTKFPAYPLDKISKTCLTISIFFTPIIILKQCVIY